MVIGKPVWDWNSFYKDLMGEDQGSPVSSIATGYDSDSYNSWAEKEYYAHMEEQANRTQAEENARVESLRLHHEALVKKLGWKGCKCCKPNGK